MRKFTLLFAFLLSLIGVAQAQTVITDLGSLSNDKVYILSAGDKGTLQVNDDATAIVRAAELTKAENQQFAILKSIAGTYHLYSVSAQKIVSRLELKPFTGSSDFLASAVTLVPHAPNGEASGKFVIKSGNDLYNINGENNLVVNGWNTHDAGNGFQIEEVGDLGELSADMQKHLKISTSTAEQPVYYAIKNTRANKYASAELSSENRMRLVTLQPESFFYFTDASAAAKGEIPEGGKAVYIHNVATNKVLAGHTQNPWGDDGMVYYIVPAAKVNTSNTTGYVITKSLTDLGGGSSWNNFQGQGAQVDSWNADDEGSIWSFEYKTAADLVATIEAVLPEAKATAIAEADIEKNRAYYSVSEEAYNECVSAIYSLTATNCSEYLAAKENMQTALAKLKVSERVNPLQGGEIVIIHNRKNAQRYITTDAAEEKAEAEVSLVKGKATVDTRSLWTVVAVENGKFKLCNALSGKYIQHQGDNNLTLVNAEDATAYAFINKENHWILIDAGDVDNRHVNIRDWQGAEDVAGWTDENDQGNHWEIIAPTAEQLARLVELQTPIETLKAEAVKQLENKIEAFKNENNALDFYNVSAEAITVCENAIKAEIQNVTTHAALEVIKNGMDAAIAQLWNSADNRVNPVTAGVKVKFRNKAINKYMVAEAAGVNTADNATSASVWTLVDDDDANTVGYYLYNPLNHTYVKHAADNGQQATLVADKAQATLYEVIPTGAYVFIRETVENNYNEDYLHADTRTNFVTRWLASDDRSLWTVTSATEVENSQLASDIQTNITPQLNAALDAANEVVAPYKPLEFYRPTQAIDAYEAVIATITGVDTYDELAQALAAVASAKAAFEAAIAADDVVLANPVANGTRVKFINRENSNFWITSDGQTLGGKLESELETTSAAVLELVESEDAEKPGFYLYHPLTNKYVKHPAGNETIATMVDKADADVYTITPVAAGLFVNIGKGTGGSDYLHGVTRNGVYKVFQWDATTPASHWTVQTISTEDLDEDIAACVGAQFDAYKQLAADTVAMYQGLTYYTASEAALAAYNEAVNGITVPTDYASLHAAQAAVSSALQTFKAAERANPLTADMHVKFVNKANPALWMNTNAGGVTAEQVDGLQTVWTLKANNENTGFYLLNELEGKYVKHPEANGNQATLVDDMAEASLYRIQPNGFHINLVADVAAEENSLHYGAERYVTRWVANHDASLWNFEVVSAEQFQALLAHDMDSCKQLALLRIGVAAKSAFYAPTADAISVAQTSVEAVDAAAVATLADFKAAMASINAAMTTMYSDGLNNGASPQGSNKLLRLRNKLYPTHFLGFGEDGLYHYETVETGGNVMPVDDDVDPGMTSGEVDILHSTESTIWNLETPTGSVPDERMYLKNVMIQSYAEHQYYDNWHVKLALKQAEAHPEIIELVGVVRDTDNNMSIKYEDMSFAESGEKCFLVYTTEGTSSTNNALFAAQNGIIVNGVRTSDASMWAIAEATDIECANMGDYSVFAYHQYVFAPTINMAKQYYCETTETVEDEEGNTSTITNVVDYIDGAKAGYYHYAGGIKDGEGNEITDIEEFQTYYWTCLKQAIDLDAASEAGVHNPAEAMDIVNILNENMAALVLNRPNRDGFFRIRCVHNNHYLQSDDLNKDGRLDLSEDNTGIASIFYFDALDGEGNDGKGSLVSYKEGYYFTQGSGTNGHSGIYVCLQPIGKMGDVLTLDVPANKEFGSYNISSDNTQNQNGRRYLFGAAGNKTDGYYPDNGSDATQVNVANDLGGNTGYNWVLERVEELPLTINSYGYSTFYAPVALNVPEGVEAFICTGVDEQSELTLQSLDVIPAGTAVILKAEELAGQEVYFTEPNNTPMPLAEGENYLHGGIYKTWRTPECQNKNPEMTSATGVNHNLPYLEENVTDKVYTLSNKNGKVAMYQYAGNKFTHFRSFLKLPEAINVALASTLDFGEIIEGPTAIEEAPAISLEDAIIYDLSGRRVAEPGKGVYIVNGKKVYFK